MFVVVYGWLFVGWLFHALTLLSHYIAPSEQRLQMWCQNIVLKYSSFDSNVGYVNKQLQWIARWIMLNAFKKLNLKQLIAV